MGTKKAKPAAAKKAVKKVAKKAAKKTAKKAEKQAAAKSPAKPKPRAVEPLDLSSVPGEAVAKVEKWICLACVLDVFTRLMGLAPKTAHTEIRNYTPSAAELWATELTRPYFAKEDAKDVCPYCG